MTAPAKIINNNTNTRIELFFSSPEELRERVKLFRQHGYTKFNLVNKNANSHNDDSNDNNNNNNTDKQEHFLLEWAHIIHDEVPDAHVCVHYSCKYNKVARKGNEAHVQLLLDTFSNTTTTATATASATSSATTSSATTSSTSSMYESVQEILLVSGGKSPSKPQPKWNTLVALQLLQQQQQQQIVRGTKAEGATDNKSNKNSNINDNDNNTIFFSGKTFLAVAYNPYIPNDSQQKEETERLVAKLQTGLVSKIYLQFGTDLGRLKEALIFLSDITTITTTSPLVLAGSVFLPTAKLIAQQKFRPWNGVHLSDEFLSGNESATNIVIQILKLYRTYNVEALWEAPGIRTKQDLELVQSIQERVAIGDPAAGVASNKPYHNLRDQDQDQRENDSVRNNKKNFSSSSPETKRQKVMTKSINDPCLLLFGCHDIRLYDNHAVLKACQRHAVVIPVFLWSPITLEESSSSSVASLSLSDTRTGNVRAQALEVLAKDALTSLQQSLQSFGLDLICRYCPSLDDTMQHLHDLVQETGATAVYYNKDFTPNGRMLEQQRSKLLQQKFPSVQHVACQSVLLYDVDQVSLSKGFHGGHWGTLMPFLKNCLKNYGPPRKPIPRYETFALLEEKVTGPSTWPQSEPLSSIMAAAAAAAAATERSWHQPIRDRFPNMSYEGAHDVMDVFFRSQQSGFRQYETERNRADKELATSSLSVHLRLGTLSPTELHWKVQDSPLDDKKTFSRRLFWRDLAYYQLRCFPNMSRMAIRAHYQNTEWVTGTEEHRRLEAWKWGRTGYPIVDAGMRELYKTGWMTQSVRMVVASFLVEYLRISWVRGCEWFHYTLADADTAINAMMWQNAGKSGIDQWNFVVSPESGSQDPSGSYTRKWVPELARIKATKLLHQPWKAPPRVLEEAGVVLGETYPHRIITDLKEERAKSIKSTLDVRRKYQEYNDSRGYDLVHLPNGERTVVFTKKEYRIDGKGEKMATVGRASSGNRGTKKLADRDVSNGRRARQGKRQASRR